MTETKTNPFARTLAVLGLRPKHPEVKTPTFPRAEALEYLTERLSTSSDNRAKSVGDFLKLDNEGLVKAFKKARLTKNPNLTPQAFLQDKQGRSPEGSRWINGPGWKYEDLVPKTPLGGTGGGYPVETISNILGRQISFSDLPKFSRFERSVMNHELGFDFPVRGMGDRILFDRTKTEGRFSDLKDSNESSAGIRVWVRLEEKKGEGKYLVGPGAIVGYALEIPFDTDVQLLEEALAEQAKQPSR